ncbi:MAG: GerAB/ArcD/ProY family transporter [Oscillospiraceae bacterium]|nr:GerAB/ArcD/ProY family transporter [Oscillospiraceae bacterium]
MKSMQSFDKQFNISAIQIIFILLICRYQSFMISIDLRKALEINNSNVFISMIISLFISFLILIPAFILIKKFKYKNIIDISIKTFPKLGNIISIIFSIYFLLVAMAHIANTDFFMISYIYLDSSPFLIIGIILVALYAVYLGPESIFRSGTIIFVLFFILNAIVFIFLIPVKNTHYLGPFVLSDINSILDKASLFSFSAEVVAILILTEYSKQKTFFSYSIFQVIIFIMEFLVLLMLTLSMGRYSNTNMFPLYTVSSMIEIPILARLESFYIVLDTMLSVIKTSIYLFLSCKCLNNLILTKKSQTILAGFFGLICLIASLVMIYNIKILSNLLAFINSPIVILALVFITPLILLIANKIKARPGLKKLAKI